MIMYTNLDSIIFHVASIKPNLIYHWICTEYIQTHDNILIAAQYYIEPSQASQTSRHEVIRAAATDFSPLKV